MRLEDTVSAIYMVQANTALQYIPNNMKEAIIGGLDDALGAICNEAWDYYSQNDVPEVTSETEPLLRTIVEYHYEKGA